MEQLFTYSNDRPLFAEGKVVPIIDLGRTDYADCYQYQLRCHSNVALRGGKEKIIITEHNPVYTCGRTTKQKDRPFGSKIPVFDIERGGELTYHGPGQIVGYPILDLASRRLSIPQYLRRLENGLVEVLREFGVEAKYLEKYRAGLWVGEKKIVSIGIAVRRWVTFHGFALNVDCDLEPFHRTQPCGLSGERMTSLAALGFTVEVNDLKECVKKMLLRMFFNYG